MKNRTISLFTKRLWAMLVAMSFACLLAVSAFAAETNAAVTNDTTGVVQIKVVYTDDQGVSSDIQDGTGFLINDRTVITCNHVVTVTPETLAVAAERFGIASKDVQNRLTIQISVLRDVTISATVKNSSVEMDYAILDLQSQLYDRTYLPIRSSAEVQQTETVYALGFPGEVQYFQDVNTYTSDDVTITSGQVNKLTTIAGVDYIQTSTKITSGNSGCPLVDVNGNVVGICQGATGDGFDLNNFYAIAIDQLTKTLDALGIDYTKAGAVAVVPQATTEPEPVPEVTTAPMPEPVNAAALQALVDDVKDIDTSKYETEGAEAFMTALQQAQAALSSTASTQEQINGAQDSLNAAFNALVPAKTLPIPMPLLIGLVIALVVVIIIVIVVILLGRGKRKDSIEVLDQGTVPMDSKLSQGNPVSGASFNQVAPQRPVYAGKPAGSGSEPTGVLNAGAGETSVLNAGAGETSVLSANYGSLTRVKTGESIKLNNANFLVGKERGRVNYCISDNTSISRCHISIINRGGKSYVSDCKTTNGTFLNGARLTPNQETALNNGDKLMLADEEFVFHV